MRDGEEAGLPLGASPLPGGRCSFVVWAPLRSRVDVHLLGPRERLLPLARDGRGYHSGVHEGVAAGDRYTFRLDGGLERPDPASRLQPEGVHGPSEVVDPAFEWTDAEWPGFPRERLVFYQVHVGVFALERTTSSIDAQAWSGGREGEPAAPRHDPQTGLGERSGWRDPSVGLPSSGPGRPEPAPPDPPVPVAGRSVAGGPAAGGSVPAAPGLITDTPLDRLAAHLDAIADVGVTALQLMPLAQFPGERNWGYDGAYPFAVQASYGGPLALKRLVGAAHRRGLAVFLDAVFNHLGPEGSYVADFGPYWSERCRTPWGPALNFDGPGSDEVRRFFVDSARRWVREFHVDGLRLDAVHSIVDLTARPFLAELAEAVRAEAAARGRPVHLVAESNLNDPRVVTPEEAGGLGLDAQWNDDFHHALHARLTGERAAHSVDFGSAAQVARALGEGFVLTGQRSAYRGRRHGRSSAHVPPDRFVVFAQNHDRVGNRPGAERLASLVCPARLRLAAAAVALAPGLPLLFMGEEDGETAPFPYFVSHGDPSLVAAVREARRVLLAGAGWPGEAPDPQAEATFRAAALRRSPRGEAALLRPLWRELLRLRRETGALAPGGSVEARAEGEVVHLHRRAGDDRALLLLNLGPAPAEVALPAGPWRVLLDTADQRWAGPRPAAASWEGSAPLLPWQALLLAADRGRPRPLFR